MKKISLFFLLTLALAAVNREAGLAAQLRVDNAAGTAGEQGVLLPVQLIADGAGGVTAIQVDLDYDPCNLNLVGISAGESAQISEKSASFSTLFDGNVRTMVYGLDQTVIPDGTVFEIHFDIPAGASVGSTQVSVENPIPSDALGNGVALQASDGTVTMEASGGGDSSGGVAGGCFMDTVWEWRMTSDE